MINIQKNYKTTLITDRLIICPWQLSYASSMYKNWASDDDVTKYLFWETHKSEEETKSVISLWINEPNYNWCIIEKESNEPIGSINVVRRNDENLNCEIGYCLSKSKWNKGYMTEALKKVIEFLFTENFYKIEAKHAIKNGASGQVMEKSGMLFESECPCGSLVGDTFYDNYVYYILNPNMSFIHK